MTVTRSGEVLEDPGAGASPPVPTTKVQVAMSFSNLAIPGIGATAMQVRFLQKQGVCLAGAVASGGVLATVASIVAQCMLFPVALLLSPTGVELGGMPTDGLTETVLLVALVTAVVTWLVLRVPALHGTVVPPVRAALRTIAEAGALAALGVSEGVAIAAILTTSSWGPISPPLPAVVGWFATRDLRKKDLV